MKRLWFLAVLVALLILVLVPSAAQAQFPNGFVQPSFPQALGANVGMRAFPSIAVPPSGLHFQFGGHFGFPSSRGRHQQRHFRFRHHPRFQSHPHFGKFRGTGRFRQRGFSFGFHSPGLTIIIK
jgi:hypothetical protein